MYTYVLTHWRGGGGVLLIFILDLNGTGTGEMAGAGGADMAGTVGWSLEKYK